MTKTKPKALQPRTDLEPHEKLMIPKLNSAYHFAPFSHEVGFDIVENRKVLLTGHMGCISGESSISLNRASKSYQITIAEAYRRQELGLQNKSKSTKTRSFLNDQNRIGLHNIVTIKQSGIKETFELTLANGKTLRLTSDHEVKTDNGFIALENLSIGKLVMCDQLYTQTGDTHKPKNRYKYRLGLKFHPFADATTGESYGGNRTFQVLEHRLVAEALLNQVEFSSYLASLRNGIGIRDYQFLNPQDSVVHHIDGNHKNNNPENLEVLDRLEHLRKHGADYVKNFGQGKPEFSPVASIERYGEEMTYDIICEEPHRNFVANGIVIHNCGKTSCFEQIAARVGQPVRRVNLNGQTTIADFVGFWTVKGGETVWVDGALPLAMRRGYWLIIDELDFGEPQILSVLNPVCEKDGVLFLKEKGGNEFVAPHEKFRLLATANTVGIMEDCRHIYQGANIMNRALLDRFRVYHVEYLTPAQEAKVLCNTVKKVPENVAGTLVKLATDIRTAFNNEELSSTFSLRQLIDFAELLVRKREKNETMPAEEVIMEAAKVVIYSKVSREDGEVIKGMLTRIASRKDKV